ncbi:MAG TPA: hypothetical protein VFT71_07465 [Candidatus Nitrosocosmicus sp.]|nr:hypothetical protein [Candidatus Nitrosocosmicus sp.]
MKKALTFTFISIAIVLGLVGTSSSFIFLNLNTFATSTLSDSIQESQNQLQSTINSQVQQSITDTINNINNSSTSSTNKNTDINNISSPVSNFSSSDAIRGGITSLQLDSENNTLVWVLGGVYNLNNLTSQSPHFNASFYMTKSDGNSSHSHDVYNSNLKKLSTSNTDGNSTILNGTTTVSMKEGPVVNVPTNITLLGDSVVKIWLDPTTVNHHFGNSPIYGTQGLKCIEMPNYCK